MAKSRQIEYRPPSYEQTLDRAERKGSMFDSLFKDVKMYKPKQGANLLRILPPGWPKANHYGLTVFVHGGVGPNDRRYLCLRENPSSPHKRCPVCEELYRLGAKATQDDRNLLRAKPQVIYYVVDRDAESDGVQLWMTSPTTDSEIAAQSINRRSKSVLNIVDVDDGYDVEFTRTGTTRNNTRYRGFQILREPSPLAESNKRVDEWLDVAFDKPLPSLLQYYSPEHIEEVFYGQAKDENEPPRRRARDEAEAESDDADDGETRRPSRNGRDEEAEERPARRARVTDDEDDEDASAPRARRRQREERETRDDDTPPRERARERTGRGRDNEDEPAPRSRLSSDLDDEIPSDAGRRGGSNGRAEEEESPRASARRPDPEDEQEERPRRRRPADDEDEESETAARESRRARMRERLSRE